jgi:hypothetical protein
LIGRHGDEREAPERSSAPSARGALVDWNVFASDMLKGMALVNAMW